MTFLRGTPSDHAASPPSSIKILCFTWNVGNAKPDDQQLAAWLPEPGQASWDIVAVGTQENAFKDKAKDKKSLKASGVSGITESMPHDSLRDLAADEDAQDAPSKPLPKGASQGKREKDASQWDKMVAARLGRGYCVVKHVVLWEMRLTVYAKVEWMRGSSARIHHVQSAISATGVAGVLGNKGGLVVRFDFGQTSLAFCSCHLAAHAPKLEQRNKNCQEILRETEHKLGTKRLDLGSQFDHVFWIGDLNYRTDLNAAAHAEHLAAGVLTPPPAPYGDEEKHHQAVLKLIEQEQWAKLYEADQLKMCQRKGDAFAGFRESPPNWAPTFKVKRSQGTDYKNQRIPSYCDRVLWKSMPPLAALVEQTRYVSLPEVTTSDHKPVLAEFNVQPTETVFEVVAPPRTTSGFAVLAPLFSPRGLVGGSPSSPRGGDGGVRRNISGRRANRGARPSGPPLIRITHLELSNLMDMDMGGGSDPYCIFFTNPPGLLADDRHAPVTTVKNVKPKQRNTQLDSSTVTIDMPMERVSTVGGAASVTWSDKEMPLLRPKGVPPVKLPFVTLIVAVYDWDRVGVDDLLGVALVPLCPPTYVPGKSAPLKEEYDIPIDQKLVHGNMSAGVGDIFGNIRVSFANALDPALEAARRDGAGEAAKKLSHHTSCGNLCL